MYKKNYNYNASLKFLKTRNSMSKNLTSFKLMKKDVAFDVLFYHFNENNTLHQVHFQQVNCYFD